MSERKSNTSVLRRWPPTPRTCVNQTKSTSTQQPRCMAVCRSTGKRCKNWAKNGFSKDSVPTHVRDLLIQPAVKAMVSAAPGLASVGGKQIITHVIQRGGGSVQLVDCCLFCDLHMRILSAELRVCGRNCAVFLLRDYGVPYVWKTFVNQTMGKGFLSAHVKLDKAGFI